MISKSQGIHNHQRWTSGFVQAELFYLLTTSLPIDALPDDFCILLDSNSAVPNNDI